MPNPKQTLWNRSTLGCGTNIRPRDSAKAIVETAFDGMDRLPNESLITEAGKIVDKLLTGAISGPLERSAAAGRFLKMRDILEDRIARAPRDAHFLPKIEGVRWRKDDPLAGIVEGISPFHMADWIGLFFRANETCGRLPKARPRKPSAQTARPISSGGRPSAPDLWKKGDVPPSDGIEDGLKEPNDTGVPGASVDLALETLLNLLEAELLGVIKTAFDITTQWVNSLREGVQISTRRFAIKFLPHVIANTAAGIKGAPKVITRRIQGGNISVKGQEIDWSGMTVPVPSLRGDVKKIIWDAESSWHAPQDRIALDAAEKMAVERAQAFLGNLNKKQNGARLFLWLLRKKYKGDYYEIVHHVAMELRRRL